jgi:hypothetical protein
MKALLVRVGIDSSDEGHWNAPVDTASEFFAYVPIVEIQPNRRGFRRFYGEIEPALRKLDCSLPAHLVERRMHLDPDFEALTYGDQGQRAKQICKLQQDDMLVFYASLRDCADHHARLVYALVGLYVVREIVPAKSIERKYWKDNAHTRRIPEDSAIVVRARPKVSGRLERCIPIGEYRDRAYRVRLNVLRDWGGLSVKDGYLQRSARLPVFTNPDKFYRWFNKLRPTLLKSNNP